MSADDYQTIKFHPETSQYYVCRGSMSLLEDGVPAFIRPGSIGFDTWGEAAQSDELKGYSEYGLLQEHPVLEGIYDLEGFREYVNARVESAAVLAEYLEFFEQTGETE